MTHDKPFQHYLPIKVYHAKRNVPEPEWPEDYHLVAQIKHDSYNTSLEQDLEEALGITSTPDGMWPRWADPAPNPHSSFVRYVDSDYEPYTKAGDIVVLGTARTLRLRGYAWATHRVGATQECGPWEEIDNPAPPPPAPPHAPDWKPSE